MRFLWILAVVVVCGVGFAVRKGYIQFHFPPPVQAETKVAILPPPAVLPTPAKEEPKRRIAPPGYYYLMERVSVMTDSGVHGLAPGTKLALLSRVNGKVRLTDGETDVVLRESQITNDQDLGELLQRNDASSQQQIRAVLWDQKLVADRKQADLEASLRKSEEARVQMAALRPVVYEQPKLNPLERGAYDQHHSYYFGRYYYGGRYYYLDRWGGRYYVNQYGNWVY